MPPAPQADSHPADPIEFIRTPTPQLRALVGEQQAVLPPLEFQELIRNLRAIFEKFSLRLSDCADGIARARTLHQLIDQAFTATAGIPISCHKGCSGCCHYEVEITADEAALLQSAVAGGTEVDRDRLRLQAVRERKSPEWVKFWSPANRCVFLGEDGACRVYDDRPSICRKHVVTTPSEACTTIGAPVAPVRVAIAEVALSAAISLPGVTLGSLSKMLEPLLPA